MFLIECEWYELQKSAEMLQQVHTVVSRHADTMDLQQTKISRLESELADSLQSCATELKERDDTVNEIKRELQQNNEQISRHKLEVSTVPCITDKNC